MVLKIVKREITLMPDKMAGEIRVDRFFDDFHNIVVENVKSGDFPIEPESYCFTRKISEAQEAVLKKITLIKQNSAEYVYADSSHEVYLMSDAGKTIEKLN